MCTVTYHPTTAGFILTHNRDEAPARSPEVISRTKNRFRTLLFPRDTKAGGAWIIADNTGKTACLLNGAFLKHAHTPPYRRSRGLLLLECFEAADPDAFLAEYDYTGIEPFTLLLFFGLSVQEIRWDGAQRFLKILAADQAHFWNSATLYPPEIQVRREQVFRDWLPKHLPTARAFLQLHRTGTVGDPENDYVMNRANRVRTVSITQVIVHTQAVKMRYFDLLNSREDVRTLTLQPETSV